MRASFLATAALWTAGVALVVLAAVRGGATVSLVLFIPVVTGSSVEFLLGVVLLIAGFFAFLFAASGGAVEEESSPADRPVAAPAGSTGAGGLVLIGPVPIVFGSWRGISRRARWMLVIVGAALVIVVWLAFALLLR